MLDFESPVVSKDGKRIFAIGSQPRCELIPYDGKFGFAPYLDGMSIRDLSFFVDGQGMAYVTVPEGQLWRSRVDGSERPGSKVRIWHHRGFVLDSRSTN
jgi:hypothetical protein